MVARQTTGLMTQSVNDEILVFNPERNEATALNRPAALVFDLCDGTNSVQSMVTALNDAGLGPSSEDAVWLALTELNDAGLIALDEPPASHLSRRDMLKKIGVGAAATAAILPVVETIAAPSAAAQGSRPAPTPGPGTGEGDGSGMTPAPSAAPTVAPTAAPTIAPTVATPAPTGSPTAAPTPSPTQAFPSPETFPSPTQPFPSPETFPSPATFPTPV